MSVTRFPAFEVECTHATSTSGWLMRRRSSSPAVYPAPPIMPALIIVGWCYGLLLRLSTIVVVAAVAFLYVVIYLHLVAEYLGEALDIVGCPCA